MLAQLTFDPTIVTDLLNYKPIISILDNLVERNVNQIENPNDKFVYENILLEIRKIKWNLNVINSNILPNISWNEQEHIMISYNSASRETCLKIKDKLNAMGHKVWIDVNGWHIYSLFYFILSFNDLISRYIRLESKLDGSSCRAKFVCFNLHNRKVKLFFILLFNIFDQ